VKQSHASFDSDKTTTADATEMSMWSLT